MTLPVEKDEISFLKFLDWDLKVENESNDWMIVARTFKDEHNDFFTFSALLKKDENYKDVLDDSDWDIDMNSL